MQPNRLQQQRLSLADSSLEEQRRLKEKAVHFADQAIEGSASCMQFLFAIREVLTNTKTPKLITNTCIMCTMCSA